MRNENLARLLAKRASEAGWYDKPAYYAPHVVTHGQIHDGGACLGQVLRDRGLSKGDRVLLCLPDSPDLVQILLACLARGILVFLASPELHPEDHAFHERDTQPALVVTSGALRDRFRRSGVVEAAELLSDATRVEPADYEPVSSDTVAYATYTSGTTGPPKAAIHRHADVLTFVDAMCRKALRLTPQDTVLSSARMYFAYGLGNSVWFPLATGGSAVINRFPVSAEMAAKLSARFEPSVLYGVPTFFARVVDTCSPDSFRSLRCVVSGGEALQAGLANRLMEFFGGIPILDAIGSTEVGHTFMCNSVDEWRVGTLGKVLQPYEIRVVAPDGTIAGPGVEGDLWVRGPSIATGYWNRPTDPLPMNGGWLDMRDRVCIDDDGWVTYCCRADDTEIVGGVNVNPREVEQLILEDDAVAEAAVVGVRKPTGASVLQAFLVPTNDAFIDESVIRDIHRRLLIRLSAFKVPHRFAIVERLPRTATGKLLRGALRAESPARSIVNKLRYQVGWRSITPNTFPRTRQRWLVLTFPEQSDNVWIAGLSARYAKAIEVLAIDPGDFDRNSLAALLSSAATRTHCDGVVSFMATEERTHPGFPGISTGLISTLLVAQAYCDSSLAVPLWIVTQGAVNVSTDDGPASPSQSAAWGLGQSICLEHPDWWGGLIDLPHIATPQNFEHLHAILTCPQSEDQLAIRQHGVSARRLQEAPLPLDRVRTWKTSGTALVTGVTGRLGKHIVRWLADAGASHLVLLSRSAAESPQVAELEKELNAAGIATTLASVDMTDRSALAAVLARTRSENGPIRTIVHAAAAIGWHSVSEVTTEEFSTDYAKAVGADNLVELLEDEPPDTFILFSSAAGIWGGARQGPYAAANAHIDALASRLRTNGCTAVSTAWGLWADEGGMSHEILDHFQRIGINQISPDTALAALQRSLDVDDTLITIADVSWNRFLEVFTARRSHPLLTELASESASASASNTTATSREELAARLATQTPEQRLDTLTALVNTTTATVLAHPDPGALDPGRTFKDLGFDSLTALELRNALTRLTGLSLPTALVFDQPTPTTLAGHLAGLLTDTATHTLGPIGQLVKAASDNDQRSTLIDIMIAASSLDYSRASEYESPINLTETILRRAENAPVRLVCISEFNDQHLNFANRVRGDIQVTEILAPGFSGTALPATAHQAAQAIVDALQVNWSDDQTLVIAGQGITCIPALHALKLIASTLPQPDLGQHKFMMVAIAPIVTDDNVSISNEPFAIEAIMAHLNNERNLAAFGRYLKLGMQSPDRPDEGPSLVVHPYIGNSRMKTSVSPPILQPALVALRVSNWMADNHLFDQNPVQSEQPKLSDCNDIGLALS